MPCRAACAHWRNARATLRRHRKRVSTFIGKHGDTLLRSDPERDARAHALVAGLLYATALEHGMLNYIASAGELNVRTE